MLGSDCAKRTLGEETCAQGGLSLTHHFSPGFVPHLFALESAHLRLTPMCIPVDPVLSPPQAHRNQAGCPIPPQKLPLGETISKLTQLSH